MCSGWNSEPRVCAKWVLTYPSTVKSRTRPLWCCLGGACFRFGAQPFKRSRKSHVTLPGRAIQISDFSLPVARSVSHVSSVSLLLRLDGYYSCLCGRPKIAFRVAVESRWRHAFRVSVTNRTTNHMFGRFQNKP